MIAARRSRTVQRLAGTWRRCAAGRAQQAAATTTAAKMAVALALLNVRTAVIAARDGGGGESMAVRGMAVAAVSGARLCGTPRARRVVTRRAAARERQHMSGDMPGVCASGDDASAGGASSGGVPGGGGGGWWAYSVEV